MNWPPGVASPMVLLLLGGISLLLAASISWQAGAYFLGAAFITLAVMEIGYALISDWWAERAHKRAMEELRR